MRLVLDTATVVAGVRSPLGASAQLIQLGLSGRFQWLVSVPLMFEYEDVLCRPDHLAVSGLDARKVNELLDVILIGAAKVYLDEPVKLSLPDPGDMHVHALAIAGDADAVVTHNLRHFASLPREFAIKLYSPAQALHILRMEEQ